ncbi:MAG TPA: hypothetical protein VFR88_11830 [Microlunatus sp.]|nr:hypothetical protein [Microlunatus sp.]
MTDRGWRSQAALVAAFFEEALGPAASAVFVHGSAALGGGACSPNPPGTVVRSWSISTTDADGSPAGSPS